jgi:hypothetical protein
MNNEGKKISVTLGKLALLVLFLILATYQYFLFVARSSFDTMAYMLFVILGLVALGQLARFWLHLVARGKSENAG